jgi:hypothetical protein
MGEADLIKNWVPNQSGFLSTKLHDDSASSSQSRINMMNCKTSINNNIFFFTIRNQHDELQNINQQQQLLVHNQE